ncbi:MAG: ABC transporter permease/substrate-binding protein [Myxococcota bacterium]
MEELPGLLAAHARLALVALGAALAIAVPAGVLAHRRPGLGRVLTGAAGVVQTVPGLALLALMVPLLAALALPSIGVLPAFLGLTLYGVLPVLQNTAAGLASVDDAAREAARGVGMTERQMLFQVELPLALPVVVAGVRTATVWTVGMATLSTPIGAPSLGNLIFAGLQTRNYADVLTGCVASAVLALLLDGLVRLLELGTRVRRRGLVRTGLAGLAALATLAFVPLAASSGSSASPLRIGAKTFTEQYVLAEVLAAEAEEAGAETEVVASLGSTVAFDALRSGEIDVYVDYSGTLWATVMERPLEGAVRATLRAEVPRWLEATHGIEVLASLGFENTYAFAVRPETAAEGLRSLEDLAPRSARMSIGGDYELFRRAEWEAVRAGYGLGFRERRPMDPALMVDALLRGDVDVIGAFSTDGRLAELSVLTDPREIIPPYDALVLARRGFRAAYPEAAARFEALEGALDAATMRRLNQAVDGQGEPPREVAQRWRSARP